MCDELIDLSEELAREQKRNGHVCVCKEGWAEREERLSKGIGSPTGWPIERIARPLGDGISIPPKPFPPSVSGETCQIRLFLSACALSERVTSYE